MIKIKSKIKYLIILTLLITLPISIFFTIWASKTLSTYFSFDHYVKPFTIERGTRLYDIGIYEFMDLKNKFKSKFVQQTFEDANLYVPQSKLSKLNSDLCHNLHVIDDPARTYGSPLENAAHFLFHCPQFQNERVLMLNEIQGVMPINLPNLLFGNALYNADANQSFHGCSSVYYKFPRV